MNTIILLCAGHSSRFKNTHPDKITFPIHSIPLFFYSLKSFIDTELFNEYLIVYKDPMQLETIQSYLKTYFLDNVILSQIKYIQGGPSRQQSTINALDALNPDSHYVYIHDGARPLIQSKIILTLHSHLLSHKAAILATPSTDTIKQISPSENIIKTLNRDTIFLAQTPQAFEVSLLKSALNNAIQHNLQLTDESSAIEQLGHPVYLYHNHHTLNPKVTTSLDIDFVHFLLQKHPLLLS